MASFQTNESAPECKSCRSGVGDTKTTKTPDSPEKQANNSQVQILKSGPLFISSKGIGWTSWKKRWFILTRSSLVFYRSDPNAPPQKGTEQNLTLGGIDLNNSGSVVVKADKKLLTVLFPDGRTFTLKGETSEDLNEWKTALENALAQAPVASHAMGQNAILETDVADSLEASFEQWRDNKRPTKSLVIGQPVLLALEDTDGNPSFLEKALRFIEQHGLKVEGILRQSADVEEVERRVQDYEQGKDEFSAEEDAHVIGDCIKHVLRELLSSPVPAACCTALVEAYKTDRRSRVDNMRTAIFETFPEPNLRLLRRILKMMRIVASNKLENRMSLSAVAACMAPLLLRPLLAGDCEIENDFNMGGDGSLQLLQAAAAANHAQAIVMILLEEYERIFDEDLSQEGSLSSEFYTESEEEDFEDEDITDNDILEDDESHSEENDPDADIDDDPENSSSEKFSDSGSEVGSDLSDDKISEDHNKDSTSENKEIAESSITTSSEANDRMLKADIEVPNNKTKSNHSAVAVTSESLMTTGSYPNPASTIYKSVSCIPSSSVSKFTEKLSEPSPTNRRSTAWGRTAARKNLSMESIDYSGDDEVAIQKLENNKTDLQNKITKEVQGNEILQASLEKRKEALQEQRLALEQDVEILKEKLQKEKELRVSLESGLMNMRPGQLLLTPFVDSKTKADLEEIAVAETDFMKLKREVSDLRGQLSQQIKYGFDFLCESCSQELYRRYQLDGKDKLKDVQGTTDMHWKTHGGKVCENMQSQISDPSSSKKETLQKISQEEVKLSASISPETAGPSMNELTVETNSPSKNTSAKDEAVLPRFFSQDSKTKAQDKPSSPSTLPTEKQQLSTRNGSSSASKDAGSASLLDQRKAAVPKVVSRRSTTRSNSKKNDASGVDSSNQTQDKQSSLLGTQSSLKQQANTKNLGSASSVWPGKDQSIEESSTVNHKVAKSLSQGENVKKEAEASSPLPNMQGSQKQQQNSTNMKTLKSSTSSSVPSSEEPSTTGHSASSRKSTLRGEETALVTSSALTKLTSRLAFLKERRVQLVNELQNLNLEAKHASAPQGPPRTNTR